MPEEVFRGAVDAQHGDARSLGFDGLFEVARNSMSSVEAVLWQMNFIYNIPGDEIRGYVDRIRGRIGFWDQRYSDKPSERPLRFLALARQAPRKGLVSTGRYAEYAGISPARGEGSRRGRRGRCPD